MSNAACRDFPVGENPARTIQFLGERGRAMAKKGKSRWPWPDWIESEEGKRCADYSTLVGAAYLENRLWQAFFAGYNAPRMAERKRKKPTKS